MEKSECIVCKSDIAAGAIKCVHCGSYQNFRRYIVLGNTALSLIVALSAVLTVLIPIVIDAMKKEEDRIHASIMEAVSGGYLVSFINTGTRPGAIGPIASLIISDKPLVPSNVDPSCSDGDFLIDDDYLDKLVALPEKPIVVLFDRPIDRNRTRPCSEQRVTALMNVVPNHPTEGTMEAVPDRPGDLICNLRFTVIRFDGSRHNLLTSVECP